MLPANTEIKSEIIHLVKSLVPQLMLQYLYAYCTHVEKLLLNRLVARHKFFSPVIFLINGLNRLFVAIKIQINDWFYSFHLQSKNLFLLITVQVALLNCCNIPGLSLHSIQEFVLMLY